MNQYNKAVVNQAKLLRIVPQAPPSEAPPRKAVAIFVRGESGTMWLPMYRVKPDA